VYYPTEEEDDNGAYTNLCVFGCYQNQEAILATIARIRQESGAPLVVESLQVYEREWMQQNDPEAFKIWETFVTIE
jgi:hypothetical protein